MRMLKMNFLGTPAVGEMVQNDLNNLGVCIINPGNTIVVKANV